MVQGEDEKWWSGGEGEASGDGLGISGYESSRDDVAAGCWPMFRSSTYPGHADDGRVHDTNASDYFTRRRPLDLHVVLRGEGGGEKE